MDNYIVCVKGASGSGKSTRVHLLLKFFEDRCGFTLENYYVDGDKLKLAGVIVKELNLFVFGKFMKNGLWGGVDGMNRHFKRPGVGVAEGLSDFLREYSEDYSFIIEGSALTFSHRHRPNFYYKELGFIKMYFQYYNFTKDQHLEYLDRIIHRKGKPPVGEGEAMWRKRKAFEDEYTKMFVETQEVKSLCEEAQVNCFYNMYDSPVYDLGVKLFTFLGLEAFILDFILFCKRYDHEDMSYFKKSTKI